MLTSHRPKTPTKAMELTLLPDCSDDCEYSLRLCNELPDEEGLLSKVLTGLRSASEGPGNKQLFRQGHQIFTIFCKLLKSRTRRYDLFMWVIDDLHKRDCLWLCRTVELDMVNMLLRDAIIAIDSAAGASLSNNISSDVHVSFKLEGKLSISSAKRVAFCSCYRDQVDESS